MNFERKLKAYAAVFTISLKNSLAYKHDFVLMLVFFMLTYLVSIAVWLAVYHFAGATSIDGLSLYAMFAYFLVIAAVSTITAWPSIMEKVSKDLQGGGIMRSFIRPVGYIQQLFISSMPESIVLFLAAMLPITVIVIIVGHFSVSALTLLFFLVEVVLAWVLINLMGFIIGSSAVYLTNIYGVANTVQWIIGILGGAIVPLLFFPSWAYNLLMLTPFALSLYVPVGTVLGIIQTQIAVRSMLLDILWIGIFSAVSFFLWKRAEKKINAVGV